MDGELSPFTIADFQDALDRVADRRSAIFMPLALTEEQVTRHSARAASEVHQQAFERMVAKSKLTLAIALVRATRITVTRRNNE